VADSGSTAHRHKQARKCLSKCPSASAATFFTPPVTVPAVSPLFLASQCSGDVRDLAVSVSNIVMETRVARMLGTLKLLLLAVVVCGVVTTPLVQAAALGSSSYSIPFQPTAPASITRLESPSASSAAAGFPAASAVLRSDRLSVSIDLVTAGTTLIVYDEINNRTVVDNVSSTLQYAHSLFVRAVKLTLLNPKCSSTQLGRSAGRCEQDVAVASLTAGSDQQFYVLSVGWIAAAQLSPGQWLMSAQDERVLVTEITAVAFPSHRLLPFITRRGQPALYCLSLSNHHNYFVAVVSDQCRQMK
jgi:hypothetical protein